MEGIMVGRTQNRIALSEDIQSPLVLLYIIVCIFICCCKYMLWECHVVYVIEALKSLARLEHTFIRIHMYGTRTMHIHMYIHMHM